MTADYAGPADRGWAEEHRYAPGAETWNAFLDELMLGSCVRIMACLAGTPMVRLVDVKVVQICGSVTEIGDIRRRVLDEFSAVAEEAKRVIGSLIGEVELIGEVRIEYLPVRGAMNAVTTDTITVTYGLMHEIPLRKFPVVTFETEK